jgi:DNA-binding CsgD family transcriptional regulator
MIGTQQVWARLAWAVLALGHELGAGSTLLNGMPFDEAGLRARKRITWDEYCTMIERLCIAAGGPRALEELLATSYNATLPEMRAAAGAVVSPKLLYRFVLEVLDPIAFPMAEFRYEDLGGDRIRLSMGLLPGVRPCIAYFQGSSGAVRSLPGHLGLPQAEIVDRDIGPSHAIWDVRVPPSRTLGRRARQIAVRLVLGAEADGTLVTATVATPEPAHETVRLEHAIASWQLTPRQADVLALVATGKTNKEIAQALACADNTVELHVTHVLRKAGVTSRSQLIARFWSEAWGSPP